MNFPKLTTRAHEGSAVLPFVSVLAFYRLNAEISIPVPSESLPSNTSQIPVNRCVFSPILPYPIRFQTPLLLCFGIFCHYF
jgi:hypothetical protein